MESIDPEKTAVPRETIDLQKIALLMQHKRPMESKEPENTAILML